MLHLSLLIFHDLLLQVRVHLILQSCSPLEDYFFVDESLDVVLVGQVISNLYIMRFFFFLSLFGFYDLDEMSGFGLVCGIESLLLGGILIELSSLVLLFDVLLHDLVSLFDFISVSECQRLDWRFLVEVLVDRIRLLVSLIDVLPESLLIHMQNRLLSVQHVLFYHFVLNHLILLSRPLF